MFQFFKRKILKMLLISQVRAIEEAGLKIGFNLKLSLSPRHLQSSGVRCFLLVPKSHACMLGFKLNWLPPIIE